MALKHYIVEILEPPMLFGLLAALLGVFAAMHYGVFRPVLSALALTGVLLAQIAVNLLDDYFDYVSGLDKDTVMTKFSGGSHNLKKGLVKKEGLLAIGLAAFVLAAIIGIYLVYINTALIIFFAVGAIGALFYAKYLTKIPFFAEPLTALCFTLMGLGTFVASGGFVSYLPILALAAIPSGLQVGIALLVNEIPDRVPDKKHGRRSAAVMLKSNKKIGMLYLLFEFIAYSLLVIGVIRGFLSPVALVPLLTIPIVLSIYAYGILKYKNPASFEGYMAMAALTELVTMLIIVLAFV
jgi:1,4-dihydroxy-2-naphthoate polyprenyltransferase